MAEGVKVLRAVEGMLSDIRFDLVEYSVGAAEFLRSGDPLPSATLGRIREADAILLGAMGLPSVRWPSDVEMTPQVDLREQLDLFNGVRPIQLFHESHRPLQGYGGANGRPIDFVIIRENCEGLFSERLTPCPSGCESGPSTHCSPNAGSRGTFALRGEICTGVSAAPMKRPRMLGRSMIVASRSRVKRAGSGGAPETRADSARTRAETSRSNTPRARSPSPSRSRPPAGSCPTATPSRARSAACADARAALCPARP
ncbi:MAG: hypothetical protein CK548_00480 [Opitutia bacterium]|nr:MAG: hypothetical protein CK548_00480 [Opitutae bacterium]